MNPQSPKHQLKHKVKQYWNAATCGTEFINQKKFSREYFQAIEEFRYTIEPEIFSFAQFTRFHGKKMLEVGVGAGTDFLQWVRAGAQCHGIDLTEEAICHVQHRLNLYGLAAHEIRVGDAEQLPYENNTFDLVYSWGVIHHSPDTPKCLQEIVRVTKPGGTIKIMIYNRNSLFAFYRYLQCALLRGKPFRSFKNVLYHHQESPGTKAYTLREAKKIIAALPVKIKLLQAPATKHDLLYYKSKPLQWIAYILACLGGWNRVGWFMMIEMEKTS
jgi:ubiquinone/menaquinone biosynthesis C-methylase UbiE